MKKEDFSTKTSDVKNSFNEIEEYQYVFIIGFKDEKCFSDDIMDDLTGSMSNNKNVDLFTPEKQKEYYDNEFDFYFVFDEEDERQEFINENGLEPQD